MTRGEGSESRRPGKQRWTGLVLSIAVLAATIGSDQLTKALARSSLPGTGIHRVIGSVVILVYADNRGGFLSLGARWPEPVRRIVFLFLSVFIVALLLVYILQSRRLSLPTTFALALLAGGGVGNLLDRVLRSGYVTDFLNIGVGSVRTAIFNLADFFILLGGVMLIVLQLRPRGRPGRKAQTSEPPPPASGPQG